MKASRLGVGALVAVGMLIGCGILPLVSLTSRVGTAPNGMQSSERPAAVRPMPQGTSIPMHHRGPKRSGWLSPTAKVPGQRRLLYVSQEYDNDVVIYPEKGARRSPIGMITAGVNDPWGLYIDKPRYALRCQPGRLLLGLQHSYRAYPAGSTTPSAHIFQDLSRPLYPIVDSSGDVLVSHPGGYYYTTSGAKLRAEAERWSNMVGNQPISRASDPGDRGRWHGFRPTG